MAESHSDTDGEDFYDNADGHDDDDDDGLSYFRLPPANHWAAQGNSQQEVDSENIGDDYKFIAEAHASKLLIGMNDLRQNSLFCDVTICVEDAEFPCHRLVLASCSLYFKAMLLSDLAESRQDRIVLNGIDAEIMCLIINYAYSAEILITKNNVQALLSTANLLEILPICDACCRFMKHNMDLSNCIGIHCFAEAHACKELQQQTKNFILKNYTEVCIEDEFYKIPQSKLIEIISDDCLNVHDEETLFISVIGWYKGTEESNRGDFADILEKVRLPLVSPYFLCDRVRMEPAVRDSDRCLSLVDEANSYHLMPDRRQEYQSLRTQPRKASGLQQLIIAVGGEDDKVVLRSVDSYDPVSCCWQTLSCLPFAVSKHGLVVSGNQYLFMAGGEFPDGMASRSVWRYDPGFDAWQEVKSMTEPRSELGLTMLDGCIYAIGGWEGASRLDSVERYDPRTNEWQFIPPMKMALTSPACVAFQGRLYVTGGAVLEDGDGIDLVQLFDPHTNCWTELSHMLIPRSGSAACVLNGFIYVIGGWHASTENTNKVERYNPQTNRWEHRASMVERRYRPGVAVVNGHIYVCGGEEGWDRYHDTIERYDERTDCWEIVGEMPCSRSWLSCVAMTMLNNGKKQKSSTKKNTFDLNSQNFL